jgi:hypothetical protein
VMATTAQAAEVRNAWMLYCTRKFPLVALRSLQGYDTIVQWYLTSAPERTALRDQIPLLRPLSSMISKR